MRKDAKLNISLLDLSPTPERFFAILPADWRNEIDPYWPEYASAATIYGLVDQDEVVAGGIVCAMVLRDLKAYQQIAQQWLDKGYLYIGFLYVRETRRKQGLGSLWIKKVQAQFPGQKYWLAIDDPGLLSFYAGLGFKLAQKVRNGADEEWILVN